MGIRLADNVSGALLPHKGATCTAPCTREPGNRNSVGRGERSATASSCASASLFAKAQSVNYHRPMRGLNGEPDVVVVGGGIAG